MKMILAEGVEIRDIYRIAAEQGVRIRRLNFRRDSLEDIFLKAMEI
jgi:ABC-2 type transport system ATP-binding protein